MTDRIASIFAPFPYTDQGPVERGKLRGSGDPTFDRALAVTLQKISDTFSVLPGFGFSERWGRNAFSFRSTPLSRDDGTVIFGNTLYREIMTRREHPEVGIVAICAHEFGHIAQYKHGIDNVLIVNQRVKRLELHADFMAGYFAAVRKLEMPEFPAAIFAITAFGSGDNDFGAPQHHGTSTERGGAVVAGFQAGLAQENFTTALQTGVRYVQQIPI
jgi:hypothetical protein